MVLKFVQPCSFKATINLALGLVFFLFLIRSCHSFNNKPSNVSRTLLSHSDWTPAVATWYGSPDGPGSEGGACSYTDAVARPPYSRMVTAVGPSLFQSGQGCGACYEVKCTENVACSRHIVKVTITDSCPGCTAEATHFDLSGAAFGALALPGKAELLRQAGKIGILHRRVICTYPRIPLTFRVDPGSNPYYFATAIEYVEKDGNMKSVELGQAHGSPAWLPMERHWGTVWKLRSQSGRPFEAPFSFRLTQPTSKKPLILKNVIPIGWRPGLTYPSKKNF